MTIPCRSLLRAGVQPTLDPSAETFMSVQCDNDYSLSVSSKLLRHQRDIVVTIFDWANGQTGGRLHHVIPYGM